MGHPARAATLILTSVVLVACADASRPTGPTATPSLARQSGEDHERQVAMMDACDPTTFDAAVGPGTCVRNGGVTFQQFIAQLQTHGSVGAWHFAPPDLEVEVGATLVAVNRGGEVHTFTEVEHFGGGIVPSLNALSGDPVPVAECLALESDDFVPPGGTDRDDVDEPGTELYQCCIHPWMRTVVHAHAHHGA